MGRIRQERDGFSERRRGRRAALFAAGLAVGLAVGPALGLVRTEAPGVPLERPAPRALRPEVRTTPRVNPTDSPNGPDLARTFAAWLEHAEATVRTGADSERWGALAGRLSGAGLELVADHVIDGLEADSLERLIVSATDYEPEDLAEITDVPAFARKLARIAMDGTVRGAAEPDPALGVRPIDFSEEITWDHQAAFPQSQFASDVPRIYAAFESEGLEVGETLAKWIRVADGEIMLFKRHRLRPAADSSYVYLDAPSRGWRPGEYRVDFYRADESLSWLASGSHRVTR